MKISTIDGQDFDEIAAEAIEAANDVLSKHGMSVDKIDIKSDGKMKIPDELRPFWAVCVSYKGVTACLIV